MNYTITRCRHTYVRLEATKQMATSGDMVLIGLVIELVILPPDLTHTLSLSLSLSLSLTHTHTHTCSLETSDLFIKHFKRNLCARAALPLPL